MAVGLAAALSSAHAQTDGPVSDTAALAIFRKHCVMCHARHPTHEAFSEPPKNVALETVEDLRKHAQLILQQTIVNRAMPLGNQTGMTEEERDALGRWARALK